MTSYEKRSLGRAADEMRVDFDQRVARVIEEKRSKGECSK
jgi:hypothetical protein